MYSFEGYASKYDLSNLKVSAMTQIRGVVGSHDVVWEFLLFVCFIG